MKKISSIDQYIQGFPESTRTLLRKMRSTIQKAAPQATEKISYNIPTFYLNENLVHFAAFKNHIGFFPGGSALASFTSDIKGFVHGRGSIQFPFEDKLPLKLVQKIVKFRVNEVKKKYATRTPFVDLAAPAQRALANAKIKSLKQLSRFTEEQVANLHGMGPNALSRLKSEMKKSKIAFKKVRPR